MLTGIHPVAVSVGQAAGRPTFQRIILLAGVTGKTELAQLAGCVLHHLRNLSAKDAASVLRTFAGVRYRNFQVFSAIAAHLGGMPDITLDDSRTVIRAFSRLHFTDSRLLERCSGVIKRNIGHIGPRDAAQLLHSLTRLRLDDAALMSALVERAAMALGDLPDVALTNFAAGCAKIAVGDGVVALLCEAIRAKASTLGPVDALRAILSLVHYSEHLHVPGTAEALLAELNCAHLSIAQLTLALEAVASLRCAGADKLTEALLRKREAHTRISPALDARIQAAIGALEAVRTTPVPEPAGPSPPLPS